MAVIQWMKNVFEGKTKLSEEERFYKKIDDELVYATSAPLTLGVEFELAVLDAASLQIVHKGPELIAKIGSPQVKKEIYEHMVEITSTIGATVRETEAQLKQEIDKLLPLCQEQGLLVTGTGQPPTIKLADARRVPDDRYKRLHDERKVLNERFGTLGMHIHIGMGSGDQCIRFNNFFMHMIPHFIALSASSPFENGINTGLASIRPTITESLPVAGMPYNFKNWHDYVSMCRAIYRAGSIQNLKDMWWDIRPCPRYGTLEIRICDMPATLAEAMAIVAFVHALALWFQENQSWLDEMPRPNLWRLRENKWRAMRYGLDATIVVNNQGETRPIVEDIHLWLDRVKPFTKKYNYESYVGMLEKIMAHGNSAQRQQRLWDATQDLDLIARFNADEFAAQAPLWGRLESLTKEEAVKSVEQQGVA